MNKQIAKRLKDVKPGDLVCVEWLDASRGRIETIRGLHEVGVADGALIDSPVKSFGVFIGVFGTRSKHVVLVASVWNHTLDYGQVDTTIIPLGVIEKVIVIAVKAMDLQSVKLCQAAFLMGRCFHFLKRFRIRGRKFQEA